MNHRSYTTEFKRDAAALVVEQGYSTTEASLVNVGDNEVQSLARANHNENRKQFEYSASKIEVNHILHTMPLKYAIWLALE